MTKVISSATVKVSSGHVESGDILRRGGYLDVLSGGKATGIVVSLGGHLIVSAGA